METNDPLYMDPEDVDMVIAKQQAENAFGLIAQLRELRDRSGLRQKDVAERMNRHTSVVSNLERLGSDPRWSSLQRYAAALGVVIRYDVIPHETLFADKYGYDAAESDPDVDPGPALRQLLAN